MLLRFLLFLFSVGILITSYSCKDTNPSTVGAIISQIDTLAKVALDEENGDSIYSKWIDLKATAENSFDSLAMSKICYHLARLNATTGRDSAEFYIGQALDWVEPTIGNEKEKSMAYLGLGNIWNSKANEHQANYYYNKAAALIMADTGIDLSPISKAIMLLSAAQSNERTYKFPIAQQMNNLAMGFWDQLPPNSFLKQRMLTQRITNDEEMGYPVDSAEPYLNRLRALHQEFPGVYDESFLQEMNARYYYRKGMIDSSLYYQLLKTDVDAEKLATSPKEPTYINNIYINFVNIAASYSYKKDWHHAALYLNKCDSIKRQYDSVVQDHHYILYLSNKAYFFELQRKYDSAYIYSDSAFIVQKSFFKTKNIQAVAEMNSLYQLQTKDKSIHDLNEDIKISELELNQSYLWLTIAILLTLLLGTYLIILFYGIKQRKLRQEKEKLLLEQQLLRTQMEPHFIFNTLSAVQSFVRFDQKGKAIKYINQFSRLLRSSLELSRENLVPVDEEVETLENYLSLQQMRFETGFEYQIELQEEEDFGALMIPPMLIQPYVENAILHGIDLQSGLGNIHINLAMEDDILTVAISDSGKKSDGESKPLHRSLSGIIGKERLKILGKKASVAFTPNPSGGHTVLLRIPVVQKK